MNIWFNIVIPKEKGKFLAWVIYNLDHDIQFKRNFKAFEYLYENKIHKYYPDFIIDDVYYEIKGRLSSIEVSIIPDIYLRDLSLAKSVGSIKTRAERYLHDLDSFKYGLNLIPTCSYLPY